ncbi:hypothetical protein PAPYR_3331 [Paratrimastix pyriformis]|uniref:Uncharacterized protein n=1 Tax=Paratrimastix pyriformis TaxID=342808 RepID=A0ABQ8UPW1_9EUKA|nr:hypothetical protein PAPYR_3331 [Paratrimastix pyriformis]
MGPCHDLETLELGKERALWSCGREEAEFLEWVDEAFADHPGLHTLTIPNLRGLGEQALVRLLGLVGPQLRRLTLEGRFVTSAIVLALSKHCSNLETLRMSYESDPWGLQPLARCSKLVRLEIIGTDGRLTNPRELMRVLPSLSRAFPRAAESPVIPYVEIARIAAGGALRAPTLEGASLACANVPSDILAGFLGQTGAHLRRLILDRVPADALAGLAPQLDQLPLLVELSLTSGAQPPLSESLLNRLEVLMLGWGQDSHPATVASASLRRVTLQMCYHGQTHQALVRCPRLEALALVMSAGFPNPRVTLTLQCPDLRSIEGLPPTGTVVFVGVPPRLERLSFARGHADLGVWQATLGQVPSLRCLEGVSCESPERFQALFEVLPGLAVLRRALLTSVGGADRHPHVAGPSLRVLEVEQRGATDLALDAPGLEVLRVTLCTAGELGLRCPRLRRLISEGALSHRLSALRPHGPGAQQPSLRTLDLRAWSRIADPNMVLSLQRSGLCTHLVAIAIPLPLKAGPTVTALSWLAQLPRLRVAHLSEVSLPAVTLRLQELRDLKLSRCRINKLTLACPLLEIFATSYNSELGEVALGCPLTMLIAVQAFNGHVERFRRQLGDGLVWESWDEEGLD